jgi:hypothetical protein
LIVDDPYADPHHLRIEPTEGPDWMVTDLGSRNGTWEVRSHRQITSGLLQPTQTLRLGRTTIRVVALDQPVAAALPDLAHRAGSVNKMANPAIAVITSAVAVVASGVATFWSSTTDQEPAQLATPGLTFLLVGSIWALGWAFTNRIVAQRFRFLGHLGWTMAAGTVGLVLSILFDWVGFLWPATDWSVLQLLGFGGLFATLLVGHFQLVTEWSNRKQWRIATVTTGLALAVIGVLGQSSALGGRQANRTTSVPLKPLAARFVPATSIDGFFGSTHSLQQDVDDLAGDEADPLPTAAPPERDSVIAPADSSPR